MPDFGFVGTSYSTPSIYQDDQECINFFAEIDPTKAQGERGIVALYPTPGLKTQVQLNALGEVRGMFTMSGGDYFVAVSRNRVYKVDVTMTATQVGTLTTTSGPVSISDNQTSTGLIAYIADGVNRYFYNFTTNTFTTLPSTDGPWQGATVVDSVDGYNIYNQPGTFNWACTDLESGLSTNAYYGSANGYPDDIVSLIVDRRQVYLLKEVTTEVWTDVGNLIEGLVGFPFQRVPGTLMQSGCGAPFSVARFGNSFALVAKDTRGDATIEMIDGYTFKRISTHAVEQSLLNQRTDNAVAFTYQIEGHEMYVVTFPSIGDGLTWVFDLTTQSWHKWLYWNAAQAKYERHRANCGCFFQQMYLVGDYENGKIYSLENEQYTDDGHTIRRLRRARHLTADLQRQFFESFQIQFQPGVGLNTGQGQDPQAMLRWSNDGGSTWSNEHWVSIGKQGNYVARAIWRRLGWSRDRIFEVAVSDPIKAVIISAELKASTGNN